MTKAGAQRWSRAGAACRARGAASGPRRGASRRCNATPARRGPWEPGRCFRAPDQLGARWPARGSASGGCGGAGGCVSPWLQPGHGRGGAAGVASVGSAERAYVLRQRRPGGSRGARRARAAAARDACCLRAARPAGAPRPGQRSRAGTHAKLRGSPRRAGARAPLRPKWRRRRRRAAYPHRATRPPEPHVASGALTRRVQRVGGRSGARGAAGPSSKPPPAGDPHLRTQRGSAPPPPPLPPRAAPLPNPPWAPPAWQTPWRRRPRIWRWVRSAPSLRRPPSPSPGLRPPAAYQRAVEAA